MKYHIITFGCQMNKNDSERIASFLEENNLQESSENEADIVILNACSIRQSAVNRIRGKIEQINEQKTKPITVLTGCIIEEDKKNLGLLFDYILPIGDFTQWPLPFLSLPNKSYFEIKPKRSKPSAYISIMTGCDNFCTYCVVPYTKGGISFRPAQDIINEAKEVINDGFKEIWLLGQNVNAYKTDISFPDLLREINKIKGDFWIRFTSSHPKDFTDDTIKAMKECKKITNYLNLPVQSGDDEILKKMNRPYTISQYKSIISKLYEHIPDISLSTDIIVGFPGETEKHFRNTINLFNEILYDMVYIGRFSPRPHTAAYNIKETVSESEKKRREKVLNELLKERNWEKNATYVGKKIIVLPIKSIGKGILMAKTRDYKTVKIRGSKKLIGTFVTVKINKYSLWGLQGEIIPK